MGEIVSTILTASGAGSLAGLWIGWMHHQLKPLRLNSLACYVFGSVTGLVTFSVALLLLPGGADNWPILTGLLWLLWALSLLPTSALRQWGTNQRLTYYAVTSLGYLVLYSIWLYWLTDWASATRYIVVLWGIWSMMGAIDALSYALDFFASKSRQRRAVIYGGEGQPQPTKLR